MSFRRLFHLIMHPASYFRKNKPICIVFIALWIVISKEYNFVLPSFEHWARIGRLIWNVDKYSKLIPLEAIANNEKFIEFSNRMKILSQPPYIIFFDRTNFDVTLNHICNLKFMPGALQRLAAVAFDPDSERELNKLHPSIPTITIDFSVVREKLPADLENKKYITYQLVLLLRARVAAALAEKGVDFWAMQQDSIWTENFSSMKVEKRYPDVNMLFDTVGNDQFPIYNNMKGWICGSTFFVRGNQLTAEFFKKVALLMTRRQSPDSSIMTYLCGARHYKCAKLPKWIVSSSNFFMGNRNITPIMIQIDHESSLSKIELFKKENFLFYMQNGTCNATAVANIKQAVSKALLEVQQTPPDDTTNPFKKFLLQLNEFIGFDPYHNKYFLRVHETLV